MGLIEGLPGDLLPADHGHFVALRQLAPDLRKIDVNDVAELLLRIGGDADRRDLTLQTDIFVIFGETGGHRVLFRT